MNDFIKCSFVGNTPEIESERLILRKFTKEDSDSLFLILKDKEVNTFLPWFPLESFDQARKFLQDNILAHYQLPCSFHYAICLKTDNIPISYINISDDDSHDLGYGLGREFWHNGIVTEACIMILANLKKSGLPYITATHDIKNPRSGEVMKKIGMTYRYSYVEHVQPKDIFVTFRMYQLLLNDHEDKTYTKYWNKYSNHFIENMELL